MKQIKRIVLLVAALTITLGVSESFGEDAAVLTRAQWLKKVGACVTQDDVLRQTLAQVLPEERVEFTQRILKAVKRMPVSPEEKSAAFVRTAVACIAGSTGELRYKIIAEVFADVPVEFLPVVTEELAKRFDQEYNKLSDEAYQKIASAAITVAVARNAQTDEPSVRDTFVVLAFLRGAKNPKLREVLLGLLPDARIRGLANTWLDPALKDRNYEALLAAADVDPLVLQSGDVLRLVGHTNIERLLFDLSGGYGITDILNVNGAFPTGGADIPVDFGINRLPRTYQNQSGSI
jgi:hypothetical protein